MIRAGTSRHRLSLPDASSPSPAPATASAAQSRSPARRRRRRGGPHRPQGRKARGGARADPRRTARRGQHCAAGSGEGDRARLRPARRCAAERYGRLDGLLHNAGMLGTLAPIEHYDVPTWCRVLHVNLTAAFALTQVLLPALKAQRTPRWCSPASCVGRTAAPTGAPTRSRSSAIEGLAQMLARGAREQRPRARQRAQSRAGAHAHARQAYPAEDLEPLPLPEALTQPYLGCSGPPAAASPVSPSMPSHRFTQVPLPAAPAGRELLAAQLAQLTARSVRGSASGPKRVRSTRLTRRPGARSAGASRCRWRRGTSGTSDWRPPRRRLERSHLTACRRYRARLPRMPAAARRSARRARAR